jgi:hypothetical protein
MFAQWCWRLEPKSSGGEYYTTFMPNLDDMSKTPLGHEFALGWAQFPSVSAFFLTFGFE